MGQVRGPSLAQGQCKGSWGGGARGAGHVEVLMSSIERRESKAYSIQHCPYAGEGCIHVLGISVTRQARSHTHHNRSCTQYPPALLA